MRAIILTAAVFALAACDHASDIGLPNNTAFTPRPDTGGPCGDGRVLRPGEQCP